VRFSLTLYPNGTFDIKFGGYEDYNYHNEPYARYGWSSGTGEGFLSVIGDNLNLAPDRCARYAPAPAWLGMSGANVTAAPATSVTNDVMVSVADGDGHEALRRFRLVVLSDGSLTGYYAWAAVNGLGGPEEATDGQPNLVRYVFDKPSGDCNPFTDISLVDGKPVVRTLAPVNTEGVTIKVLSTTDLADWSHAEELELSVDPDGGLLLEHDTSDPARFYRLQAEEQ
jgi:hypothetical protein